MRKTESTGDKNTEEAPQPSPKSVRKRSLQRWAFPVGIGLAGMASAAAILFRGCWHRNMSWPKHAEDEHGDFSYQVCNDCGIVRLFDERLFRGYGPYGYDLHGLIAREHLARQRRARRVSPRDDNSLSKPVEPGTERRESPKESK